MNQTTTAPDAGLLTIADCARALQLGRTVVYQLARTGKIPVIRIGRAIRVPRQALFQTLGIQDSQQPANPQGVNGPTGQRHNREALSGTITITGSVTFELRPES